MRTVTRRGALARLATLGAAAALPRPLRAAARVAADDEGLDALLAAARPGLPPRPADAHDPAGWARVREHWLLPRGEAFFNAGTVGAPPRVVLERTVRHLAHVARDLAHWDYVPEHEQYYAGYYPERALRAKIAALVGTRADEISLIPNATTGMNLVAHGLDLGPGDEVLLAEGSHAGSRTAWELRDARHGVRVRVVPLPPAPLDPDALLDAFERATGPRTRVWALEHLTSAGGIRWPVETMCARARERGLLSVVDGAQTAGHLQLDLRAMGCDAFFTSAHKWLCAPVGTGFLYVRADVQPRLWTTLASERWDHRGDDGFRLQQHGTASRSVLEGLDAALDVHARLGSALVEARACALAARLRAGLARVPGVRVTSPAHPAMRTGTVVWTMDGLDGRTLQDRLWALARVRVRRQGEAAVRQCCHFYNLEEEVERTIEAARKLTTAGARSS